MTNLCAGVRVPDADFIREVCRQHGGAIALTSANPSGSPSCVDVREFQGLWPGCAVVFDGGTIAAARDGSTIVDLCVSGEFRILRKGSAYDHVTAVLKGSFGLEERMIG